MKFPSLVSVSQAQDRGWHVAEVQKSARGSCFSNLGILTWRINGGVPAQYIKSYRIKILHFHGLSDLLVSKVLSNIKHPEIL